MEALFDWVHNTLGMHFYTLPMLIAGFVMLLTGILHQNKQNKREKEFEEKMNQENE